MISPLGLKSRVGCLIIIAEAYAMHIPGEPHLVLHLNNLLKVSIVGQQDDGSMSPTGALPKPRREFLDLKFCEN